MQVCLRRLLMPRPRPSQLSIKHNNTPTLRPERKGTFPVSIQSSLVSGVALWMVMLVCHPLGLSVYHQNEISPHLLDWIAMKFGKHVHGLEMMSPTDFGDP